MAASADSSNKSQFTQAFYLPFHYRGIRAHKQRTTLFHGNETRNVLVLSMQFCKSGKRPHRRVSAVPSPAPIALVNTRAQTKCRDLWFQSKHTTLGLLYTLGQCSLHHLSWLVKNLHSWSILFREAAVNSRPQCSDGTWGWKPPLLSTPALLGSLPSEKSPEVLNPSQGTAGCTKALASPNKSSAAKNRAGKELRQCQDTIVPKNSETTK